MRHLFITIATAVAFMAGCTREADFTAIENAVTRSFTASFASDDTRTEYKGEGKIEWAAGDVVRYYSYDGGAVGSHTVTEAGRTAEIEVELGGRSSYLVAEVGGSGIKAGTSASMTVTGAMSSSQDGSFGSAHLAVAKVTDMSSTSLSFATPGAIVKFSLDRTDIGSVQFRAMGGETICGDADITVSWENGTPVASASAGKSAVKVEAGGAGTYFFSVIPGTLSKGFRIDCYDARENLVGSTSYSSPVTLAANEMLNLGTLDSRLKKSISILAIGNSFSWDAMEYLYPILKEIGYQEIHLGNLYIGGCTLATHSGNMDSRSPSYQYRTNDSGSWKDTYSYVSLDAIDSRAWDVITVQQASGYSGIPSSYEPYLTNIVNTVASHCPSAQLMWHMTWAYQGNSTHSDFGKYDKDQETMYNAIVSTVQSAVFAHDEITGLIPCGTAVQNLRTSFIGDTITRDGYHMSYDIGRYLTALMWARSITHCDISSISYKPSGYTYGTETVAAIKEAVDNAYAEPLKVTKSSYAPEEVTNEPDEELRAIFTDAGYKLSDYEELVFPLHHKAYYNSQSGSTIIDARHGSTASNLVQFTCTDIFTRSQLPEGTVLVLKKGYQYRPEAWTALTSTNTSSARPQNVTTQVVVVNTAWWGSWNYRAFNLAKEKNPNLTDAEQLTLRSCFGIYIPKKDTSDNLDEILANAGYNPSNYTRLPLGLTKNAYYDSSEANLFNVLITLQNKPSATNCNQFSATRIFGKEDIPAGSVIVQKADCQYRPDGWVSMSTKNASSARPGTVTGQVVEVDATWWGKWNHRAFNISKTGHPALTDAEQDELAESFAVYIPR